MNNDTPADAITQADIEAARSICGLPADPDKIRFDPVVQDFARHRTTSLAAQDGLVDALRAAKRLTDRRAGGLTVDATYAKDVSEILEAALASIDVKSS